MTRFIILLFTIVSGSDSFAVPLSCEHSGIENAFRTLVGSTRLKNCELEVVNRIDDEGNRTWFLLLDNRKPFPAGSRTPGVFEFMVSPACLPDDSSVSDRFFQYSDGFVLGDVNYRRSVQIRFDSVGHPVFFKYQLLDLNSHQLRNRIVCGEDQ